MATGDIEQSAATEGFAVTSLTLTSSDGWSTPTSGNTLVAVIIGGGLIDGAWSGWTQDESVDSGANDCVEIWRKTSAGTESSITADFDTSEDYALVVYELEGVVTYDVGTTNYNLTSVTSIASGSTGTLSGTTSIAIGGSLAWNFGVDHSWSNSYTVDHNDTSDALRYMAAAHKNLTGTTATSSTASWTSNSQCAIAIAVYTISSSVDDTATPNDLAGSSTFPSAGTSAGAGPQPNDLTGTATFDAVAIAYGAGPKPSVLDSFAGFPSATAISTQDASPSLTALAGSATFPAVNAFGIDGEVVNPVAIGGVAGFPAVIASGVVNADAAPNTLAGSMTAGNNLALGSESSAPQPVAMAGTSTFPTTSQTTTNNEDVSLTALYGSATFPFVDVQAKVLDHFYNSDVGLAIEIAFDDYPLVGSPTWTNITGDVRSFTITRGRKSELDEYKAGVATILIDANQGDYDPTNTAGAHYPDVVPMKQIRIRASYGATTYTIYRGLVEHWPTKIQGHVDETVTLKAVDGLKLLNAQKDSTPQVEENSATRIGHLLDEAGWPAALRTLGSGVVTVPAYTPDCQSVLALIRQIKDSEGGQFYIDRSGNAVFRNRTYRNGLSAVDTFGDGIGEIPYQDIQFDYDDSQIWNRIEVLVGGFPSYSSSTESQDLYGIRQLTVNDILLPNTTDGDDLADVYRDRYKDPKERIEAIKFKPEASPADLWPHVLGRNLSDKIIVVYRTDAGNTKALASYIEAVSHKVSLRGRWETTWSLSQYI